jgi:hypothetical protein
MHGISPAIRLTADIPRRVSHRPSPSPAVIPSLTGKITNRWSQDRQRFTQFFSPIFLIARSAKEPAPTTNPSRNEYERITKAMSSL